MRQPFVNSLHEALLNRTDHRHRGREQWDRPVDDENLHMDTSMLSQA